MSRLTLATADGVALEAERFDPPAPPNAAAVIAHPHPLYGGDMHNNVVSALCDALPRAGVTALRFNFRGVGGSAGTHGKGVDERLDVVAAVDALAAALGPAVPLVLVGYSFGAMVCAAVTDERVSGWALVAPPLGMLDAGTLAALGQDPRPKSVVMPGHDQFTPLALVESTVGGWAASVLHPLPTADHFLMGHTAATAAHVSNFIGGRINSR